MRTQNRTLCFVGMFNIQREDAACWLVGVAKRAHWIELLLTYFNTTILLKAVGLKEKQAAACLSFSR